MRLFRVALIISLTLPAPLFAQTSSGTVLPESGTGSISGRLQALAAGASDERIVLVASKQAAWEEERAKLRAKLSDHRNRCYEELREANRDEMFPLLTRCYRSDLLQEVALLRKERLVVETLGTGSRENLLSAIDALIDANMAIVDALDSNVFDAEEGLRAAKAKLREQYRTPYLSAGLMHRASRLSTWITKTAGLLLESGTEDEAMVGCLEGGQTQLHAASNSELPYGDRMHALRAGLAVLRSCSAAL